MLNSINTIIDIINDISHKRVVVIGDIMLDEYIFGTVKRVSSCTKLPIIEKQSNNYCLGGAANVAANLAAICNNTTLIGRKAEDCAGKIIQRLCDEKRILLHSFPADTTIHKQRVYIEGQQVIRLDSPHTILPSHNNILKIVDELRVDLIVIADYVYGFVDFNMVKDLIAYSEANQKKLVINSRNIAKYEKLKLPIIVVNEKEYKAINRQSFPDSSIFITLADRGIRHIRGNVTTEVGARPQAAKNVSGAGDSSLSVISLLQGTPLTDKTILTLANIAGESAVLSELTHSISINELISCYFSTIVKVNSSHKIVPADVGTYILSAWKSLDLKVQIIDFKLDYYTPLAIKEMEKLSAKSHKMVVKIDNKQTLSDEVLQAIHMLARFEMIHMIISPNVHSYISAKI